MKQTVAEVEAEIEKQQKKLTFLKRMEQIKHNLRRNFDTKLDEHGLTIGEIYPELSVEKTEVNRVRKLGTPKFRGPSGETYDGRGARRADEFAEFLIDEHLDVQSIADAGLLNPEWVMQRRNRMPLMRLGIKDVEEYLEKHQLQFVVKGAQAKMNYDE